MTTSTYLPDRITQSLRSCIGRSRPSTFWRCWSSRPQLESLEQRALLSTTWMVTDNSDSPTDVGSLRYAVNNEPSGTTISFASSVTSPIALSNGALNITTNLDIEGPGAS